MPPGSPQTRSSRYSGLPRLVAALVLAVACGPFSGQAAASSLLVVSDPESPFHQAIVDRLAAKFDARQGADGRALVQILDEQQFADRRPEEMDQTLVITIGAKAAAGVRTHAPAASILHVFLPLVTHRHLQTGAAQPSAAIVLDQPLARQLAVARVLLPRAERAAMLGSAQPADPWPLAPGPQNDFGFELSTTLVDEDSAPVDAIRDVLRNGEVVIITFDPQVYTPVMAKWLLYLASQKQQPLIGFSRALLEAGALASVFSTPEQIAQQTIEVIEDWLGKGQAPVGIAYPRYYHVAVNPRVARQLGIEKPSDPELEHAVRKLLEETQ